MPYEISVLSRLGKSSTLSYSLDFGGFFVSAYGVFGYDGNRYIRVKSVNAHNLDSAVGFKCSSKGCPI